jgi:hypothetical protein
LPIEPTSGNGRRFLASTPTIPTEIDWQTLSPEAQAIARQIALPLSLGYSQTEIAKRLRIRRSSVGLLVDMLADELEQRNS